MFFNWDYFDESRAFGNGQVGWYIVKLANRDDAGRVAQAIDALSLNSDWGLHPALKDSLYPLWQKKQIAFVPFALDRQVVVDRSDGERDAIARVISVQRGVFSTEMRHIKKATLTIHNRLDGPTVVYIRHTVTPGYELVKGPAGRGPAFLPARRRR